MSEVITRALNAGRISPERAVLLNTLSKAGTEATWKTPFMSGTRYGSSGMSLFEHDVNNVLSYELPMAEMAKDAGQAEPALGANAQKMLNYYIKNSSKWPTKPSYACCVAEPRVRPWY